MNRRISCFLSFTILALLPALSARAVNPHLVVMAVNSGGDLVAPYDFDPPTLTPGAKGFLIGVDTGDTDPFGALTTVPMSFTGPDLVHKVGIVNGHDRPNFPRIMTQTEAGIQSMHDSVDYAAEDTYLIDKLSSSMGFDPVAEGILGGLATDHYFTVYASANTAGSVPNGVYPLAYVVTTSDVAIFGIIGRDALGAVGYGPFGNRLSFTSPGGTAVLDFATGTIVPEPSSLVLAALGVVGIILLARGTTSV